MPGGLEEYLKLYDEADRVARQLHLALSDLSVPHRLALGAGYST